MKKREKKLILLLVIILLISVLINNNNNNNNNERDQRLLSVYTNEESESNLAEKIKSLSNWTETPTIYHHNSYLTDGAHDNSYRFNGSSEEVENYVCFGYDKVEDDGSCPEKYLYRIIGIFDDDKDGNYQVKLIKNDYVNKDFLGNDGNSSDNGFSNTENDTYKGSLEYIDSYYWLNPSEEIINDWENSDLNKTNLNINFINYITDWKYLIDENNWQVGGINLDNVLNNDASSIYEYELGKNKQEKNYKSQIGLMYVSDYMYAAAPKYWKYKSYSVDEDDYELAADENWLYNGLNEWTISKRADNTGSIIYIMNNGKIQSYTGKINYAVRPTFYLKWNVNYIGGDGKKETPYIVSKPTNENEYSKTCNDESAACMIAKKSLTDKNIIYHDGKADYDGMINAELEANDLSYRYSGASDIVDNFVCLDGTSTSGKCQSDNDLYRIIGIFKNGYSGSEDYGNYEIKLIKYDYVTSDQLGKSAAYLGNYSQTKENYKGSNGDNVTSYYWNYTNTTNSNSMWAESDLNKTNLNTYYLNTYLAKVNKLANNIVSHNWEVSGVPDNSNFTVQTFYNNEIGSAKSTKKMICMKAGSNTTTRTCTSADYTLDAKIGLMYISDYGYASYSTAWNTALASYTDTIRDNNWMLMGLYEWTISRYSDNYKYAWDINNVGKPAPYDVTHAITARPCFYLISTVKLASGEGTHDNPYRLTLS